MSVFVIVECTRDEDGFYPHNIDKYCCPVCKKLGDSDDVQYDSYITYHYGNSETKFMIWAECCDGRFIADPSRAAHRLTKRQLAKKCPQMVHNFKNDYYAIRLAFITHIVDTGLTQWMATAEVKPTYDEICQIIGSPEYKNNGIPDEAIKKFNMMWDDHNTIRFDFAISVNSYNGFKPSEPFPAGMRLEHDGQLIYFRCCDIDGDAFGLEMWGD
jgi:hypothetical protein